MTLECQWPLSEDAGELIFGGLTKPEEWADRVLRLNGEGFVGSRDQPAKRARAKLSNGDHARYGSIPSEWEHFYEWKRQDEADKGKVDAEILLDGMLAHDRLLDIVENFILFDESKPGATRKVVARNHQVLDVNRAVSSVGQQELLKREFPPEKRLAHRVIELPLEHRALADEKRRLKGKAEGSPVLPSFVPEGPVAIVERAHPDLGRLGVFAKILIPVDS